MKQFSLQWITVAFLLMVPAMGRAQETPDASQEASPQQAVPVYNDEQLDQMLAPVALYPDPLLAQILMASTYPLEIVEAQRWQKQNASLKGDQLASALEQQPWDPSVKALASFPQVMQMMDNNLQWTEQLGDAFLASQPAVMDSVQRLRQQAEEAGHLKSTPQQTVAEQGQDIVIQPANPQTMYVPYYNPTAVYGTWPYPDYQPYYFPPPPGYISYDEGVFGFGIGVPLIVSFWDWDSWDWRRHRIDIDDDRFRRINHDRAPIASGVWQHDPAHRHGVPYRNAGTRAQFQHVSDQSRRNWRGYAATAPVVGRASEERGVSNRTMRPNAEIPAIRRPSTTVAPPVTDRASTESRLGNRTMRPNAETAATRRPSLSPAPSAGESARVNRPESRASAPVSRRAVPAFESFSRGSQVRAQAERGSSSRSAPVSAPAAHASAPSNARAAGGGRGGDERRR